MSTKSDKISSTNTPSEAPLGVKNPIVSPIPLGQKFLQPIGARSISVLDLSLFSSKGVELQRFSDWDSPFLLESKPDLGNRNIIQEKPLNDVDFSGNSEIESIPKPTEISPIPTSESSAIRRELDAPFEDLDNINQDQTKVNYQQSQPSKSTIFRSILGDYVSPKSNRFYPPKYPESQERSKSHHSESIQRQYESSTSEPISDISPIQRLSETSDSGDINDAIASNDSPSIQRLSETSDSSPIQRLSEISDSGDINNAIASNDSPSIQRLSETSDSGDINNAI
ncbi:MAG: hypothetical protein P5701_19430, partial [Limnospira sp. Paracas R14]|nr:hypothetical protein [Limnospira sp. Paracas R14]